MSVAEVPVPWTPGTIERSCTISCEPDWAAAAAPSSLRPAPPGAVPSSWASPAPIRCWSTAVAVTEMALSAASTEIWACGNARRTRPATDSASTFLTR